MTLIGQKRAETLLARAVYGSRVGHAYLFLGPPGSGKNTAAHLFARAINCAEQPAAAACGGNGGVEEWKNGRMDADPLSSTPPLLHSSTPPRDWRLTPCGRCESCRRILAGTHPEVIEVRPGSKGGQNISVEQAREIRSNAALRPKVGGRRVYLIPRAEAFSEDAANCLLKTLEEPSDFVTMILCAPSPSHVLPTIRSRCQVVRFGLAPVEEIEAALTTRGTTPQIARELARACGGRPGLALTWSDAPSILKLRRGVLDLFIAALAAQEKARRDPSAGVLSLRLAEQLKGLLPGKDKDAEEDEETRPAKAHHNQNLETGLTLLRDLLLLTCGADAGQVQNQDRLPELEAMAGRTHPDRVLSDLQVVREAQQLLERNVQPQIVFERMFWALISGPLPVLGRLFEEALA